jgi:16S rRNA processing protein RimM
MKDNHSLAGSLLRTFGTKGEIILKFEKDLPEKIKKLESIFIKVDGKLVPFFIVAIQEKSINTALVKLEGIDSEKKAQEFINADFYLPESQIKILDDSTEESIDITGYIVKDQHNKFVGQVIEFLDIPENPLLKVKTSANELFLPANDQLIIGVNDDERVILLHVAEGIIDLDSFNF